MSLSPAALFSALDLVDPATHPTREHGELIQSFLSVMPIATVHLLILAVSDPRGRCQVRDWLAENGCDDDGDNEIVREVPSCLLRHRLCS